MPIRRILLLASPEEQARLRPALEAAGRWDVAGTANVQELLSAAARLPPDLFVLADSSGAEPALQALHDQLFLARLPAFVLADEAQQHYLSLGADRVLPADPASLPLLLRSAYEESRLRLALGHIRTLGGEEFVREMADLFRDHAPQQLALARQCLAGGDLEAVRRTCHSLKSSAGNIGAVAVHDLAERAEDLAHRREAPSLPKLLDDIEATLARFLVRLAARASS